MEERGGERDKEKERESNGSESGHNVCVWFVGECVNEVRRVGFIRVVRYFTTFMIFILVGYNGRLHRTIIIFLFTMG